MTREITVLAEYPALTVFNPKAFDPVNFSLDEDKGYCRVGKGRITIRAFPRDKYEYIRNFYFGAGSDGEYFCNPEAAMITAEPRDKKVTFGYELGDTVTIEGKKFKLTAASNNNIKLEEVA
jgi:hypothetical protein